MPHALVAFDPIATRHVPHGSYRGTCDDRHRGDIRVLFETGDKLPLRHEAVDVVTLIGPAGKPGHPVRCQEAERIPTRTAPAFGQPAALGHGVVDAKPAETMAHGEPGLSGADDDHVGLPHGS